MYCRHRAGYSVDDGVGERDHLAGAPRVLGGCGRVGCSWGGLLLVVAVLPLRWLPAVLALRPLLGLLRYRGEDVLLLGWFGPIGAAALYHAAFSYRETGIEAAWTVGNLGSSAPPY